MRGPVSPGVRQRHVRHALDRHVHRRVREGAPVRALEAHGGGDGAVELVAHQRPVAHQIEGLGRHALPVDAHGGQPVLHRAVTGHVHDGRAVRERPELIEGGEGRSRVGRLVPDGPVELGGVPDRFMDREPEIRRVDDEVVRPGLHRGRGQLLGEQLGQLGQLGVPVPAPADVGPVRNSHPRPTGGANVRIVSKPASDSASASSCACSRTRCWVARVPLRSAR